VNFDLPAPARAIPGETCGKRQSLPSSREPAGFRARHRLGLMHSPQDIPMTKLYIGNLPFSASEESVRALFTEFGAVQSLSLVNDRATGTPRGFGFIEMSTNDASRAMHSLNGKDFEGRPLKVNEAQDRNRPSSAFSRR
jgi:RNA recognition motif-containing protein